MLKHTTAIAVIVGTLIASHAYLNLIKEDTTGLPVRVSAHHTEMNTDFSEWSNAALKRLLKADFNGDHLLTITSFGGMPDARLIDIARKMPNLTTYVPDLAYSMGADLWLMGDKRIVSKHASVIFHSAQMQMGEKSFSQRDFEDLLAVVEENLSVASLLTDKMNVLKLKLMRKEILARLSILKIGNEEQLALFDDVIKQSNGKLTKEIIVKELFHDFRDDIAVSGQKLFDMGIATEIAVVDESKF